MTFPTTVVFDVGNVLLDWNPRHLYRKLFDDPAAMEMFLAEVCTPAWNCELDRGRPFAEAVADLVARFPDFADAIRAYDARWSEMIAGEIEGTVALLERLAERGVPLYALTNLSDEKYESLYERHAFFRRFAGVLVSGRVKMVKPDPAIYRLLLESCELRAEQCLFIDDSAANVDGARRVGLSALQFESPAQIERVLVELRLL
ncbi:MULTISPECIES: HAD family hydrolase [Methylosinus]|uniref:HAD family phosphatase n=1 Tax=Methylosinus trichosporium (strain ATCC 35070 / NCIMB 11131 / UNIQEM 75 / OB3b) TaxID=595536 RepID=A0A2D2D4R8_METT3|nr:MULTISPECIES: HAD family phosphatase [Methylosinus]ATQ70007.1 HAD family phosphatase [Methylosinus trichosporium OB3b]OBS50376.1 2-haloalkanoic acid dehalogenase [Methylosinus sp. 3S-1]